MRYSPDPDGPLVKLCAFQLSALVRIQLVPILSNLFSLQTDTQNIYLHVFELL